MDLSDVILKIRKEFNLSQSDLAKRLYRDQRTISSYERGKITPPIDFLTQLTKEFNLEISIKNNEFIVKRGFSMKEQIYNFIVNNRLEEDYLLDDLISYDELTDKYGEALPYNFNELLSKANIDTKNIVGALCNSNRQELGIFYLGEHKSRILFWHPLYVNFEIPSDFDIETPDDKESEDEVKRMSKYTYFENELWIALLQRDIEKVSNEQIIQALYSSIHSLLVTRDPRIKNLAELDIEDLKTYVNDVSLSCESIKAIATVYTEVNTDPYILFERFHGEHPTRCNNYYEIIDIPSDEVLICTQEHFLGEDLIATTPNYYKNIKNEIINRMLAN